MLSSVPNEVEDAPILVLDSKSKENSQFLGVNIRSSSNTPNENERLPTSSKRFTSSQKPATSSNVVVPSSSHCNENGFKAMKFTCFPCCYLGNIASEFEREEKCMESSSICQECAMGSHGCRVCVGMCCLSSVAWPCSPCLSCYLMRERWKINLFHPYDTRFPPLVTLSDYFLYYFCWMKNLEEQYLFIQQLKKEGNLTFSWDYSLYYDQLPRHKPHLNNKPYPSYSLIVFGPNTTLKQQFLRKLLRQTNTQELAQLNQDYPLLNDIHHIQTGVRSMMNENTKELNFLEIWDIPINHFDSSFIHHIENTSHVFVSLFLFDIHDYQHFQDMKKVFLEYEFLVHKPRMIVILKDPLSALSTETGGVHSIYQLNQSSTENLLATSSLSQPKMDKIAMEAEILTWAKRQGVIWYHVSVYDEYSYVILNKQLMKLIPKT